MKGLLRSWFISALVLYVALAFYPGMSYDGTWQTLGVASGVLMLLNKFVKPMIKLLLLPINLITLGLFRWVAHVLTLFLLVRIVTGFEMSGFFFTGWEYNGFIVPAMQITLFMSFILGSIVISLIESAVKWVLSSS